MPTCGTARRGPRLCAAFPPQERRLTGNRPFPRNPGPPANGEDADYYIMDLNKSMARRAGDAPQPNRGLPCPTRALRLRRRIRADWFPGRIAVAGSDAKRIYDSGAFFRRTIDVHRVHCGKKRSTSAPRNFERSEPAPTGLSSIDGRALGAAGGGTGERAADRALQRNSRGGEP